MSTSQYRMERQLKRATAEVSSRAILSLLVDSNPCSCDFRINLSLTEMQLCFKNALSHGFIMLAPKTCSTYSIMFFDSTIHSHRRGKMAPLTLMK